LQGGESVDKIGFKEKPTRIVNCDETGLTYVT